jgi:hypothetical protein
VWAETPIRLFLAALVPLVVATPLRILYFPDTSPFTVLLLGPAFEESLKLAGVVLALTIASLTLSGGRDPDLALRYWLFFVPWIVGGLDGLVEGLAVYPRRSAVDLAMREFGHATFVALSVAAALFVWRRLSAPLFGIGFGFAAGFSAHIWFNGLSLLVDAAEASSVDQQIYLALVLALTLAVLAWQVRTEPASAETRAFLPARGRRVQP